MNRAVARAVELGMTDLSVMTTERTQMNSARLKSRIPHLKKIIASSTAQCQQMHMPVLHPETDFDAVIVSTGQAIDRGEVGIVLHPGAPPLPADTPQKSVHVLIGPEGGWSPDEVSRFASSHLLAVGLGRLVLRAETAPLAILSALRQINGWC
jgi:16S rRNA (uracil1498-N3)-methyltransferase